MPPRKNNPLSEAERVAKMRDRNAAEGKYRREFILGEQALEDEAFIRTHAGVERVRSVIEWVFAQERERIERKLEIGNTA